MKRADFKSAASTVSPRPLDRKFNDLGRSSKEQYSNPEALCHPIATEMQYAPPVRTGRCRIRSRHDAEPEIQHRRRGHSTCRERTAEKPKDPMGVWIATGA